MTELRRALGLLDATNLVVGTVIGSAIFLVPSTIATLCPFPGVILLAWVLSGVLAFFGALCYAELGASLPATGGQYVFLREAFGPLVGFLYGWTLFLVIHTGSIAALAAAFSIYLSHFFPLDGFLRALVSVGLIVLLTWLNIRGIRVGARVQNLFTLLKLTGLAVIIVLGLSRGPGCWSHFQPAWPENFSLSLLSVFGAIMISTFWAFEGWHTLSFTAGEIQDPQRNIPLALGIGVAIITAVYLLANVAYLYLLPVGEIAASERVASDAAVVFLGPAGASFIALAVLCSVLGANNGTILSGPRVFFAMARDGVFFEKVAEIHPRFQTPAASLVGQAVWSVVLALTGTYEQLFTYLIFGAWIFYILTIWAVFALRRKHPNAPRPFRVWGYPWTPLLFILIAIWFVLNTAWNFPRESAWGMLLILTGLPAFFYWRKASTPLT